MKSVLVIIDIEDKDKQLRDEILKYIDNILGENYKKHFLYLDKMDIKSCLGCFNCWVKTPGKCIIKDENEIKNRLFIESDYNIFISKISYGMYSSSFKVVLDRIIPNISPFFKFIDGEMHHKKRYNKELKIFTIGYDSKLNKSERETFQDIVNRNMINLHCDDSELLIVENTDKLQNKILGRLNSLCGVK